MRNGFFARPARALGLAATTLALGLASGAPAQASLVSTSACDASALSQPFAQWGDSSLYKQVPGGTFEGGAAGWSLRGGAALSTGSDPYAVTGTLGKESLNLPPGASAQSPVTCVNAGYPTFRFVARNNGLLSTVLVQVVYRLPLLGQLVLTVGSVAVSGRWEPSASMITGSAIAAALTGGTAQVALRFTSLTGDSQIDDVFLDPRMMR